MAVERRRTEAANFRRAVQHKPSAHARSGARVDLVEERRAEEVGAVDRGHEVVVPSVERPLVVDFAVVDTDLCPRPDADIVVVVGVGLEPGQTGLIDDAGGVVDDEPIEEGAAVGRDREAEPIRSEEAEQAFVTKPVCNVSPRSSPAALRRNAAMAVMRALSLAGEEDRIAKVRYDGVRYIPNKASGLLARHNFVRHTEQASSDQGNLG